jgi:hypothetical protein
MPNSQEVELLDGTRITIDDIVAHAKVTLVDAASSHASGYRLVLKLTDEKEYEAFSTITKRKKGKAGGRYRMFLINKDEGKFVDVWFLGWTVSNTAGAKVKFDLSCDEDFAYFRERPVEMAWDMTLIELDDDEKVIDQQQREVAETVRGGPKSQLAGKLCADMNFQRFVAKQNGKPPGSRANPEECANFIRAKCRIGSRRELDHDEGAFQRFTMWVSRPFAIWSTPR